MKGSACFAAAAAKMPRVLALSFVMAGMGGVCHAEDLSG